MGKIASGCLVAVLLWLLLIGVACAPRGPDAPTQTAVPATDTAGGVALRAPGPDPDMPLLVGDEGVLDYPGRPGVDVVFLAVADDAWDPMTEALIRGDLEEVDILIARGKVIRERVGTRVKVIGSSFTARKVRIRDGAHPGAEAWVETEFVRRPPPPKPTPASLPPTPLGPAPHVIAGAEANQIEQREEAARRRELAERAAAKLLQAKVLERSGNVAGALRYYREILRDAPDTPAAATAQVRARALEHR
jgi:hypothetical protein